MQHLKSKHELNRCTADVAFVATLGKVFVRTNDEWVEKAYFTFKEVARETKLPVWKVREWARKLNMKDKLTLSEIKRLSVAIELRSQGKKFKEINQLL